MDAQRATGTVREVFKDMARMVPFPVTWHPRTVMAGHMPGTLQVDGRAFEFGFSFRNTPTRYVAAHVLNLRVEALAFDVLAAVDVAGLWASWTGAHSADDMPRDMCGVWDMFHDAAGHVTGMIGADMEAYAQLLTIGHALTVLEHHYRTA